MHTTRPLKSAWLVTWEWIGDHAHVEESEKIVAVLNYRWSSEKVRDLVEQLYAAFKYGPSDKAAVAHNKKTNPYCAKFGSISGVPWGGEVMCGHNPWLYARSVKNFRVKVRDDGTQQCLWEEVPRPNLPQSRGPTEA